MLPDAIVAFMRFNPDRQSLSLYPSQRFSKRYQDLLQDVPISPDSASFGGAACQRQLVVTEDIHTDSRWLALGGSAETEGLRAVTVQTKTLFQPAPPLTNLTLVSFITGVISHVLSITSQAFACAVATAG